MKRVSARLGAIKPSATMAITTKAKSMRAAGVDVIGFAAGEPDFPSPDHVVRAAVEAVQDVRNHKYSAATGLPELKEAIAGATLEYSGVPTDPADVVVTNGGKQAVFNSLAAIVDDGDEVLLPSPYWVTYPEAVALAGGTPVVVETDIASGFKTNVEQLERHLSPATKALLFVSPSNPTGAVYTDEEVRAIGTWAADRGIWVITDEIYDRLVYGDAEFVSMPGLVEDIRDRCIIVNGVAKTYAMTGWRVGWMTGPSDAMKASGSLMSHSTSNVANVTQRAALAAVTGPQDIVEERRQIFDRRRQSMLRHLSAINGVTCLEPNGAFYAFPDLRGVLGKPIGSAVPSSTLELAEIALDEAHVAFVPGEAFGAPGYGRFSYSLSDEDLDEGMSRFARLLG